VQIPVEKEAKKKAVHTKQLDFQGQPVEVKSNNCVFCEEEVDKTFAEVCKSAFGEVICVNCIAKMVKIIAYAGARSFQ